MPGERMTAVLALLAANGRAGVMSATAAADALAVDAVSAGVGTGPQGVVLSWGHQAVSVALEDLQLTLGQGPGLEALASGAPVLVPDLREHAGRWPGFVPEADRLDVRAVFAFPLRIGAISVGALTAHRVVPGPLMDAQLTDALALADAVTVLLLHEVPTKSDRGMGSLESTRGRSRVPAVYGACSADECTDGDERGGEVEVELDDRAVAFAAAA